MRSMRQILIKAAATAFVLFVLVIALRYALGVPAALSHLNVCYTQSGPAQYMDIFEPGDTSRPHPVIVAIHGGGWHAGSRLAYRFAAPHFNNLGYAFCAIDYRFDTEAIYPAQIEDCKCAIRFLRAHASEYHIDPDRIAVWGESAGGHLAALLGTTAGTKRLEGSGGWQSTSSAVAAVVDWYGPTDLRQSPSRPGDWPVVDRLLGGKPTEKTELADDASPLFFVSKNSAPFLIEHGDHDPLVPFAQSQVLYDALKAAGVDATLKIVPGAKHGGAAFFTPANIDLVDDFLAKHLGPAGRR